MKKLVASILLALSGAAALAAEEGVQTFEPAFFRQYNPVTAADMVSRVPGFEIDDGEVLRFVRGR